MSEGYTKRSFDDEYGRHALTTDNGLEETTVDVSWLLPGRYFHPTRLPDDYVGQHQADDDPNWEMAELVELSDKVMSSLVVAAYHGRALLDEDGLQLWLDRIDNPCGRGQATTTEGKESR